MSEDVFAYNRPRRYSVRFFDRSLNEDDRYISVEAYDARDAITQAELEVNGPAGEKGPVWIVRHVKPYIEREGRGI